MAQSSGNTINQRIALTGGDEIKETLKELGAEGEEAFNRIRQASQLSNSALGRVSDVIGGVRARIEAGQSSYGRFSDRFAEMRERVSHFGESLLGATEKIIPHFQEVLGIGTAAGIAGFIALEVSAAKAVNTLSIASRELGVPIDRLQGLGAAAKIAGTEAEAFFQGLLRISTGIQQIAQQRRNTIIDQAAAISKGISLDKVTVLRGPSRGSQGDGTSPGGGTMTMEGGAGGSVAVLRGPRRSGDQGGSQYQTGQLEGQGGGVTVIRGGGQQIAAEADVSGQALKNMSTIAQQIAKDQAQIFVSTSEMIAKANGKTVDEINKLIPTLEARKAQITKLLATDENQRELSREAGYNVPFASLSEALKHAKDAGDSLGHTLLNIGIAIFDINGQKRGLEEVLQDFSNWFEHEPDRGRAASVAKQLLGENYAQLLKLFAQGSDTTKKIVDQFVKSNLGLKTWSVTMGQELNASIGRLEVYSQSAGQIIGLAFGPAIKPLVDGVADLIDKNIDTIIASSQKLATAAVPAVKDFVAILGGAGRAQMSTDFGRGMLDTLNTIKVVATGIGAVITALFAPIEYLVGIVNRVFGTEFNSGAIAAIAVLGSITGLWTALGAAVGVVDVIISAFITGPIAALVAALGPVGLVAALTIGIALWIDWGKAAEGAAAAWNGFVGLLDAIGAKLSGSFKDALVAIALFIRGDFSGAWDYAAKAVQGVIDLVFKLAQGISEALGLQKQLSDATAAAQGNPVFGDAPGAFAGALAAGGPVFGPGGIDNVPIWATAGEFMIRNAAVSKYGVGFMHAINSLMIPKFASGGMIGEMPLTLASDITPSIDRQFSDPYHNRMIPFTLDLGQGNAFHNLFAGEETAQAMINFSRKKGANKAGDKPDWYR